MTTDEKLRKIALFGESLAAQYGAELTAKERIAYLKDRMDLLRGDIADLEDAIASGAVSDPGARRRAALHDLHIALGRQILANGGQPRWT